MSLPSDDKKSTIRTFNTDPDFRRRPRTDRFCCICQRDLSIDSIGRQVFILGNGWRVVYPDDVAEYVASSHNEDNPIGWCLIGSECVKRIGLEWTKSE